MSRTHVHHVPEEITYRAASEEVRRMVAEDGITRNQAWDIYQDHETIPDHEQHKFYPNDRERAYSRGLNRKTRQETRRALKAGRYDDISPRIPHRAASLSD